LIVSSISLDIDGSSGIFIKFIIPLN